MDTDNEREKTILSEGETRKLTDAVLQEDQKYRLGDIMWAKVGGHPFWPSLIYYGPGTDSYYRKKGKIAMYHVQFFGPLIERAWVTEASLMPFEGKSAFDLYLEDQMEKDKKQSKIKHEVKSNRKAAWDASWREAEQAYPLSREDRVQRFGRIYVEKVPKENSPVKQKNILGSGKKSKTNDIKSNCEEGSNDKRFQKFFRIEKDKYLSENPDISEEDALDHLQSLWYNMTEDERGKFIESPPTRRNRSSHPKVRKSSLTPSKEAPKRSISATSNNTSPSSSIRSPPAKRRISELNSGVQSRPNFTYYPPSPSDNSDCASITVEEDNCSIADDSDENESPTYEFQRLHKSTPRGRSMEPVCNICEDSTNIKLLLCTGGCGFYYHLKCLLRNSSVTAADFKCHHCMENRVICFHCNEKVVDNGITCSVQSCGKTFHKFCSEALPFSRKGVKLVCPAHLCHACAIDDPSSSRARKGRLVRCLRCPVAYHAGELCLAAGSAELSATYIICPRHFEIENRVNKPINVSWCFKCAKGNNLVNCSRCPASYHRDCLPPSLSLESDNSSRFLCHTCMLGKQPRYGEIIWVKIGHFRWWPCEVLHPRDAPLNIQRLAHQKGMFPVHFFGSDEYYWLTKSRMFSFEFTEGSDRENLSIKVDSGTNKKLSAWFQAGLKVAQEGYVLWQKHILDSLDASVHAPRLNDSSNIDSCKGDVELENQNCSTDQEMRPAPYKFTKCNFPIGGVKIYSIDVGELPRCECRPKTSPCRSDCLNRMLMYECHPDVCPCGDVCENQRFTKKQYPPQEVFKSPDRGWALRTSVDIQKGEFVNEYVGDLVDEEEARVRLEHSRVRSETNYYMITLDKGRIIDAGPRGNFSRFMNHSCNPNLETQKWMVHGDLRIGLFAVRNISAGEELTFNYNFQSVYGVGDGIPCRCRSANCSGYLGVRPRSRPASEAGGVSISVSNAPGSVESEKYNSHDMECYRCGDSGELITCEMSGCRKSYHLFCLGLKKPPWGKWHCPWHHCDVCGVSSDSKCSKCPNSYCSVHLQGNVLDCREDVICRDHVDEFAS